MLTPLQSRTARLMAANRSEDSHFAGGAALNEHTKRVSDDLGVFSDTEEVVDRTWEQDVQALEDDGLHVEVVLELAGCVEARIRDESRQETLVQWMSETRTRFFPLVSDPLWGVRLHRSDLAVNKAIAAASRRETRDAADLFLISRHYCPLGPLFLGASLKAPRAGPMKLVDMARHRMTTTSNEEPGRLRTVLDGMDAGEVKLHMIDAFDAAESFLKEMPEAMLGGLPVDDGGVPTDREGNVAESRPAVDGGGRFPAFPESPPDFSEANGMHDGP